MKILLIGGTGAIGSHLIDLFSESGQDVTVTTRQNIQSSYSVKYIQGDSKDLFFLKSICSNNWDAIVDFMVYTTDDFSKRVDILLNSTEQYIYLSSSRVYADTNGLLTEDSPRILDTIDDKKYLDSDEYALAKARQENILTRSLYKNWTIIRPYITYSQARLQLGWYEKEQWLSRTLKNQSVILIQEMLDKQTTLTYGHDVAKCLLMLIGNKKALGEIFHITTNESCSWKEVLCLYENILESNGIHLNYKIIPFKEYFPYFTGEKYQIIYDRLFNRKFDNSKIKLFTDTKSFTSLSEGLQLSLSWISENPKSLNISYKSEAIQDRILASSSSIYNINGFMNKIKYLYYRYLPFAFIKE